MNRRNVFPKKKSTAKGLFKHHAKPPKADNILQYAMKCKNAPKNKK